LLALERESGVSLHEQLERRLREHVRGGRLAPGTRLPSSRALARELGVSRGVVIEAYAQLTAEGYLAASQGAPTKVAATATAERPPVPASSLEPQFEYDFRPGIPDLLQFPRAEWSRSLRAASRAARFGDLGAADPRGLPSLRNELMSYLARVRGTAPEPEHTLICSGFTQGLAIVCRVLRDRGVERIAVEEPGFSRHRLIAERAGLEPVPVPVDAHGIDVQALAETGCEAVIVTPAHQFPTGAVLASDRRAGLLEWAEDDDALVIEDDYDSELRFDRVPVGALQGLSPERVCHIGSISKRLAPGLGLGWILSPSWLTGALTFEKALADGGAPALEQLALADFLARGELDRHLRRMGRSYRARRAALITVLGRLLPQARTRGVAAGLFVLVMLPNGVEEGAVQNATAARGIGVEGLAMHRQTPGGEAGLILGYGNASERTIADGVRLLTDAIRGA
jgi:GntR family transcriptional regulator / MocR family aminotransferase